MGIFRHSDQTRAAQAALDAYAATGNREETPKFLELNDAVNKAIRDEKKNKKR